MPAEIAEIYDQITLELAEVLNHCAHGLSEPEMAEELKVAESTIHSRLKRLRKLLALKRKRELGDWWLDHCDDWIARVAERVGIEILQVA